MNKKRYQILLLLSFIILLVSCGGTRQQRNMLSRAERLLNNYPDSSLKILDSAKNEAPNFPRSLRMKYELLHAAAQNKAYINFTSDSVMKEVVNYYDSHGTANEQLQAHYELGSVYRDLNDAPKALQCYYDAVDKADTTSSDCDYSLLGTVHSQIAVLFLLQESPNLALSEMDKAIRYAWMAHDPYLAINTYEQKSCVYYNLNMLDSAINISVAASSMYKKFNYPKQSATALSCAISALLKRGEYSRVKPYLKRYESESGLFDTNNNIEAGYEGYYYNKGQYYLETNILDSAELYFRKQIKYGKDLNNQQYAFQGLFDVYNKLGIKDSITKYARLWNVMNDSLYASLSTKNLQQMQSLYNYSRSQRIAELKTKETTKYQLWLAVSIIVALVIIISYNMVFRYQKEKYKRINEKNAEYIETLNSKELEIEELKTHNDVSIESIDLLYKEMNKLRLDISDSKNKNENDHIKLMEKEYELARKKEEIEHNNLLIETKSREIEKLQQKIAVFQEDKKRPDEWNLEGPLYNSPILNTLHSHAARGKEASDKDFGELVDLMKVNASSFLNRLDMDINNLNYNEINICILTKLHFLPSEISCLMGLSSQNITNIRTRLLKKIFNIDKGGAKDFDKQIRLIV